MAYRLLDSSKLLAIPLINDGKISLGPEKWTYATIRSQQPSSLEFRDSLSVEPQQKLQLSLAILSKAFSARYTLRLREIYSKDTLLIYGEWRGIYPYKREMDYAYFPIKD